MLDKQYQIQIALNTFAVLEAQKDALWASFVEKPRNTTGWQVGEGTRWHCPVVAQLGKPHLNKGSPIRTHTSELVVELLHLTRDLTSSTKVPLITAHTPSPSFAGGKPMVLLKFLNNFCAIGLGRGDGSWSSRSFLLLHCPWTSESYTRGSLPLPPDSRASFSLPEEPHKELPCASDPCL